MVEKFSHDRDPIIISWTGISATAKGCMVWSWAQMFAICDVNSIWFREALVDVVKTYYWQFLNEESDIILPEKVLSVVQVLVRWSSGWPQKIF